VRHASGRWSASPTRSASSPRRVLGAPPSPTVRAVDSTNRDILLNPTTSASATLGSLSRSRVASLVSDSPALARELLSGDVDDRLDAQIVFKNLVAIMAYALLEHDDELFGWGIAAAATIWDLGDRRAMYPTTTPDREASLWENLVIGLYALGGLAVRHERWAQVRELTLQSPSASDEYSWLRQGQVASDRAARSQQHSILGLAAGRIQELSPGVTGDESLQAAAQFDLLSGLIMSETDPVRFYPNAAEFSEALVEPLVIDELRRANSPLRQQVFVDNNDGLRESLRDYDAKAREQASIPALQQPGLALEGICGRQDVGLHQRGLHPRRMATLTDVCSRIRSRGLFTHLPHQTQKPRVCGDFQVGRGGIEPPTLGLRVPCSAN
jgi:hypothetical protein